MSTVIIVVLIVCSIEFLLILFYLIMNEPFPAPGTELSAEDFKVAMINELKKEKEELQEEIKALKERRRNNGSSYLYQRFRLLYRKRGISTKINHLN